MSSKLHTLIQRVQKGSTSTIELVYTPYEHWPANPNALKTNGRPLQLSVLDSSFNCPTLAHLGLINAPRPSNFLHPGQTDYDAKLLLLSVRNADKALKPGDATFEQRAEMMTLLTRDIVTRSSTETKPGANAAVAVINEPTFVGKSQTLQSFLKSRMSSIRLDAIATEIQLTFLMGFDTLERLFSPRYYINLSNESTSESAEENMLRMLRKFLSLSPATGDNSRIVCATRPASTQSSPDTEAPITLEETESSTLATAAATQTLRFVSEFLESSPERIVITELEQGLQAYSSSEVRRLVAGGNAQWKSMVTPSIADYIERARLYQK